MGTADLLAFDTDGTLVANSDTRLASQKAVKTYVDQIIAAQDAMVFKGVVDCSANPNYPAADRGHTYRVSVAGKIGGASGANVEAGDLLLCLTDATSAGTQAAVGSSWSITQTNLDGAVIGPASVADAHFAQFDGTSGKLLKGGLAFDTDGTLSANSATRVASQGAVKVYADTKQPLDADLTALAALGATGFAVRTAADTWAQRTITNGTGISITNGDGVSGNVSVALSHLGLQNLADPNVDRIAFWDDSASSFQWLDLAGGLAITGTTLSIDAGITFARNARVWWVPPSGSSGVAISLTGTTTETIAVQIPIPANIGANAQVRFEGTLGKTGTAGSLSVRAYLGASGAGTGGALIYTSAPAAANLQNHIAVTITNRNATNSQVANNNNSAGGWGANTTAPSTAAIDTTAASELCITMQLGNAADTGRLESYILQILPLA